MTGRDPAPARRADGVSAASLTDHEESIAEQVTEMLGSGLPATPGYLRANVIVGALVALLGGFLIAGGLALGMKRANVPGPGVFPLIVGSLLLALGLILVLQALTGRMERGDDSAPPDRAGALRILATILATGGFIVLLPLVGYSVLMTLYVVALLVLAGRQPWVRSVAIAAVFSFGTFVLFTQVLDLKLPTSALDILPVIGL